MNLTIQFQYTFEEYSEGIKAINAQAIKSSKGRRSILGWVLFVGLAIMLFFILESGKKPATPQPPANSNDSRMYYPLFIAAFLLIIGAIAYFGRKNQERKSFEKRAEFHRMRTMHFFDDAVATEDHVSQSRTSWHGFIKFRETTNLFLLFVSDVSAVMIPKRAFPSNAAVDEFRTFATTRISPLQSAFPVLPPKAN